MEWTRLQFVLIYLSTVLTVIGHIHSSGIGTGTEAMFVNRLELIEAPMFEVRSVKLFDSSNPVYTNVYFTGTRISKSGRAGVHDGNPKRNLFCKSLDHHVGKAS